MFNLQGKHLFLRKHMLQDLNQQKNSHGIPWEDLLGRRIFLTGGTGFVGCSMLDAYIRAWDREHLGGIVSVLTRDPAAFRSKAPYLADHPGIEVLEGNLLECTFGDSSWELVIHAAVEYGEPFDTLERNLQATCKMLELAHRWKASRVLFTSSGAVYGPQPPDTSHLTEESPSPIPLSRISAYGEAKRCSELLGLFHGKREGYTFLIARCFAFLGPWLPLEGTGAAGNFMADALAKRPICIKGDGRPLRSYLFGEDLAQWLWTILVRGVHGRPYNVGSSEVISVGDLAYRIRDLIYPGGPVQFGDVIGQGPPPRYVPSVDRAKAELGLEPHVGLDEAIMRTAKWNIERQAILKRHS